MFGGFNFKNANKRGPEMKRIKAQTVQYGKEALRIQSLKTNANC